MSKEAEKKEGWNYLFNSSRCHYFVEGRSLCGKWGILGYGDCREKPDGRPCAACMKKLKKTKAKPDNSLSLTSQVYSKVGTRKSEED